MINYADVAIANNGDVMIAVERCGLDETKELQVKAGAGRLEITQSGRNYVHVREMPSDLIYRIREAQRVFVVEVDTENTQEQVVAAMTGERNNLGPAIKVHDLITVVRPLRVQQVDAGG